MSCESPTHQLTRTVKTGSCGRSPYKCSLGNLLLLSSAINSSIQNDGFSAKKQPKFRADGSKARNGYSDGSHSEIEVSGETDWGPEQIRQRGLKLLGFMEKRWDIKIAGEKQKLRLLFPSLKADQDGDADFE